MLPHYSHQAALEGDRLRDLEQLKSAHQQELAAVTADLRKQLDGRSAEMERVSEEVRQCAASLEEAQEEAAREAQELHAALSKRDAQIAQLKAALAASGQRAEGHQNINRDLGLQLEAAAAQVDLPIMVQ